MSSAFGKNVRRSITGSLGRFLAIAGIVALGCGFYAGLRMNAPDMWLAADEFYDSTNLYDIRLVSSMGLDEESIERVAAVEGVEEVMPGYATDVMALLHGEQYAMRITSFPEDIAAGERSGTYINQLVLTEGRWPTSEDECVLSADCVMSEPIVVGDTVEVLYGTQDVDECLDVRTFRVSGLVHASAYVSAVTLGSTSLGSGTINQYMYVSPSVFADDYPYTEVYLTVTGSDELLSGSDEYQALIDEVTGRLDRLAPVLAQGRLANIQGDAQEELDEAYEEYLEEREDAQAELDDAAGQLDEAEATIADSQARLDANQAQIDQAYAQLAVAKQELQDGEAQVAAGYDQLAAAQSEYDSGLAAWQAGMDQWNASAAEYDAGVAAMQESQAQYDAGMAYLATLDPESPEYAALAAQLAAAKEQLDAGWAQMASAKEQLDAGKAQLDATKAQLDAGAAELATNRAVLDEKAAQLAAGREQIAATEAQLADAATQLADGRAQLEEARRLLAENRKEYEDALAEANAKFADAEAELADAQKEIDDLELPTIYVLDRTANFGVMSFDSDAGRVDNIAKVFPFIFFLVAALVALTTMTRMVEEERIEIGTLKALGYSKARIALRYLIYAGIASFAGAIIGIAVLSQVLPAVIMRAYAIIYNVPQYSFPLPMDWPLALLSVGMGVGVTLLATWGAIMATLREAPAALMLPRAPKAGKRIVLERMSVIWKRISFSWKVTLRNLFRYKKRFWMTVIGIAGCTALLLTGLGLHDSIWDIIDKQFGPITRYNVIVGLVDDVTEEDVLSVIDTMEESGVSEDMVRAERLNMQVDSDTRQSGTDSALSVTVVVPQDTGAFSELVIMKDRETQELIPLGPNDVLMTEKLANQLGLSVGDTFRLYDQDEVGNPVGSGFEVTLDGIVENYVGDYLYMGDAACTRIRGEELPYSSIYATCTSTDHDVRTDFTDLMHDTGLVDTVTYNDETIDTYRTMLTSVNMIVVVLVVAAAALAFIVLYNLTNINITERRREIASLKVLGFTAREVDAYIFREILLLTIIGALLGLVLGVYMEGFVVVTAEVDQVMFGRDIHAMSFVWAFVATVAFSGLVMLFMRKKLKNVSMVESLKSVD